MQWKSHIITSIPEQRANQPEVITLVFVHRGLFKARISPLNMLFLPGSFFLSAPPCGFDIQAVILADNGTYLVEDG